ncbi:hypothetical protein J8C02_06735 [Chloracidobacterium sp. MS 40/45]|uniref:hypothetical protein n=1 Tax=Chloracidobacterium aggregatum TaxID=2851959 RepID=UPI001B8DA016|nr:hypothetical protein [Chloracidobacterium aggregatum]QUV99130.1 hypothetical protein J8C02_06735 [Chloracidobacterium sp. MS 40/45]
MMPGFQRWPLVCFCALWSCFFVVALTPPPVRSSAGRLPAGQTPNPGTPAKPDEEKARENSKPGENGKNGGKKRSDNPDEAARDKTPKVEKPKAVKLNKPETWDGETVAEIVIYAYGSRPVIDYVFTNARLEGSIRIATDDNRPPIEGKIVEHILRRETSDRNCVRIEVELPGPQGDEPQQLVFGFNGYTNWAAQNRQSITLTPEAQATFLASLKHDYFALLRYKEDGTTVTRVPGERIMGIDTIGLELTHRDGARTKYFISSQTYRILHLEYEVQPTPDDKPLRFRESFYDFRPVQNLLVPMRKELYENGKFKQRIEFRDVRFRLAKLDEDIFLRL